MSADPASEAARWPALPLRWMRRVRHHSAGPADTREALDLLMGCQAFVHLLYNTFCLLGIVHQEYSVHYGARAIFC